MIIRDYNLFFPRHFYHILIFVRNMLHFLLYQIAQIDLLSQYAFYRYCRPQPLLELRISFPVLSFCICRWMLYSVGFQVDCDSVRTICLSLSVQRFSSQPAPLLRRLSAYDTYLRFLYNHTALSTPSIFPACAKRCSNCSNFFALYSPSATH